MSLKESLDKLEIEVALLDLDDTITGNTHEVFATQMKVFSQFAFSIVGSPYVLSEIESLMNRKNKDAFKQHGVNPQKWGIVVREMATELGVPREELMKGLPILDKIYDTRITFAEGAEDILDSLAIAQLEMYLVTHANVSWTWKKYEWLQLQRFIPPANVHIVSEDRHKGPLDWGRSGVFKYAPKNYAYHPNNTMVVGDSLNGDIVAAHANGIRYKFFVQPKWEVYGEGEIPENTVVLNGISGLVAAINGLAIE